MADGKISVDVDKLYSERKRANENGNDGKIRPKTLDEIRAIDQEDRLLENMMGRGKMSMAEYLMWKDVQMRDKQTGQAPIDIEAIIAKATEPFKQQLEEMKRQQEKAEQEKKFDALQARIDKLTDLITNGTGNNKTDPIIEEIKGLKDQLATEKEKAAKAEQKAFEDRLTNQLDYLDERIERLSSSGTKKNESEIDQLINARKRTKELLDALGVNSNTKDDEASTTDLLSTGIDMFNDKAPKLVKTIGTLREGLKGGSDLADDVPFMDSIPTQLPSRNVPRENKSSIPPDILDFLNEGEEKDGGFVDLSGVQWQNEFTGKPLTRADIESKAITDPDSVRQLMELAYEDVAKMKKEKPKPKAKEIDIPDDITDDNTESQEQTAIPKAPQETAEDNTVSESTPTPDTEESDHDNTLSEAMAYINSGEEKTDNAGNLTWVGTQNETYESDTGPMTREQLIKEARDDPKAFMETVREHLQSMSE